MSDAAKINLLARLGFDLKSALEDYYIAAPPFVITISDREAAQNTVEQLKDLILTRFNVSAENSRKLLVAKLSKV